MNRLIENYSLADSAYSIKTVSLDIVKEYAALSGDYNPIHLDDEYAQDSYFGGRVAHGLFCLGEISRLIGMELPGEGAILVNERINYKYPVYIGDTIETSIRIIKLIKEKDLVEFSVECKNQNGIVVLDGTTLVKV